MKKINLTVALSHRQNVFFKEAGAPAAVGADLYTINRSTYAYVFEQKTFSEIAFELCKDGVCVPGLKDLVSLDTNIDLHKFYNYINDCLEDDFTNLEVSTEIAENIIYFQSIEDQSIEEKKSFYVSFYLSSSEMKDLRKRNEPEIIDEDAVYSEGKNVSVEYFEAYNDIPNPYYEPGSWDVMKGGAYQQGMSYFFLASDTTEEELRKKFSYVRRLRAEASHFDKDGNPDYNDFAVYFRLSVEAKKMLKEALKEAHLKQK